MGLEIIIVFLLGVGMGNMATRDEMIYELDKCISMRQDLSISLDECSRDLKLCELRRGE